ncbi:S-norcoclaurine synthase [Striga asiatica]|uniref:S-norcoclaurine synthase n=1 Tax=Striga asiatica TaxID=4170 RepID=A0A5A7QZF7_STRAF|nr:S-norcoclaurine synthase [Striga asiatica]
MEKNIAGSVSEQRELKVSASEAWKLFGGLEFADIVQQALSDLITKIVVLEGDGGVGTILQVFYAPGGPATSKEKLTVVDNGKRVKVAELFEGGYLDFGFSTFLYRWEVIEKEGSENECIGKGTIEYVAKDENAAAMVSSEALVTILNTAAKNLLAK